MAEEDYIVRVERFEKPKHHHVRSILTNQGRYATILESSPRSNAYSSETEETCRRIAKYLINAGIVEPEKPFRVNPRNALEKIE